MSKYCVAITFAVVSENKRNSFYKFIGTCGGLMASEFSAWLVSSLVLPGSVAAVRTAPVRWLPALEGGPDVGGETRTLSGSATSCRLLPRRSDAALPCPTCLFPQRPRSPPSALSASYLGSPPDDHMGPFCLGCLPPPPPGRCARLAPRDAAGEPCPRPTAVVIVGGPWRPPIMEILTGRCFPGLRGGRALLPLKP